MRDEPIDAFARRMPSGRRDSVVKSGALTTEKRVEILRRDYADPDALRRLAGRIKQHTLDHLDEYLDQAVRTMTGNGVRVHFAPTGDDARDIILKILRERGAKKVVKSKSMATEEVHLNPHLEKHGIECLETDLGVFLNLLARSATAQQLTVYTQFISGPRAAGQPLGPEEMHVVLMDNGRSDVLATKCREILRCIRCGACQNVCPVYRQASGHAYRAVYGGPIGAVLSPLLAGDGFAGLADLPKASSLCGACQEVCPVDIPIPDLLLRLREKGKKENVASPGALPMGAFAALGTSPALWRTAMTASRAMNHLPIHLLPVKPLQEWLKLRTLPRWRGGEFRKWMENRGEKD